MPLDGNGGPHSATRPPHGVAIITKRSFLPMIPEYTPQTHKHHHKHSLRGKGQLKSDWDRVFDTNWYSTYFRYQCLTGGSLIVRIGYVLEGEWFSTRVVQHFCCVLCIRSAGEEGFYPRLHWGQIKIEKLHYHFVHWFLTRQIAKAHDSFSGFVKTHSVLLWKTCPILREHQEEVGWCWWRCPSGRVDALGTGDEGGMLLLLLFHAHTTLSPTF